MSEIDVDKVVEAVSNAQEGWSEVPAEDADEKTEWPITELSKISGGAWESAISHSLQ